MHLPDIITALAAHPDATLPQSEPDAFRARGFMGLRVTPFGRIRVEYHWGLREFENQSELENWLAGIVPDSWQK